MAVMKCPQEEDGFIKELLNVVLNLPEGQSVEETKLMSRTPVCVLCVALSELSSTTP